MALIRLLTAWSGGFPRSIPDPNQLPAEWVNALNAAVAAGKIPNIPQSTNTPGVNPVYPPGVNPNSPEVCSATYKCRHPEDTWDAPPNYFGTGFDDGPLPVRHHSLLESHSSLQFDSGYPQTFAIPTTEP